MRDDKEREGTKNEVMSLLKQTWFWQVLFLSKPLSNVTSLTWGAVGGSPSQG